MIPNRKVVGSNPAKDTTRTIFTIKHLTLSLKKRSKNFIPHLNLKNIQSIFYN